MPTRVLLVGAGAVGAFFGSRLACAPNTAVSALCRSNFTAVKKNNGFKITSPNYGEYRFRPQHVFGSPDEARKAAVKWDYLLVATKALPDVSDDSTLLEGLVGPETTIVLVQNGLGIEEPYAKRFPGVTVLSAVTFTSVAQHKDGIITHNRWTRITLGPYLSQSDTNSQAVPSEEISSEKATRFFELLQAGGIKDAELLGHSDMQMVRWHKIAVNAAMNPTSVLSGGTDNQTMCTDPELSQHIRAVINEVFHGAEKVMGEPMPSHLLSAEQYTESGKRNLSGSVPSMLLDWQKGNKMELEVILGNPLRLAKEHNAEMPRVQGMYAMLKRAQYLRDRAKDSKL